MADHVLSMTSVRVASRGRQRRWRRRAFACGCTTLTASRAARRLDHEQRLVVLQEETGRRKGVERALQQSEERYRILFESAPVGIALTNYRGEVIAFNRRLCAMAGVTPEEARTLRASVFHGLRGQRRQLLAEVRKHGKVERSELLLKRKDGSTLLGRVHMEEVFLGREKVLLTIVEDITRQKQDEWRLEGVRELLELFATKGSRQDYMNAVVRHLRDWSGCRCVGIRLLDHNRQTPCIAHVGYSRLFLKLESCLALDTADCPCNRIFRGQALASDAQFTTQKGSFFCNRASRLAEHFSADPGQRARLACLHAGYESIAHVPFFLQGRLFGTIHLADPRRDRVSSETISFIETVAPLIGEALHRFQVEESLIESEQRFRAMFERHEAAMLLVEPDSGVIQDANPAAAAFYGHSRERLRAMYFHDLTVLPAQTAAEWRQRARREGQKYIAVPHRLAGGEIRTVEVHSSPIQIKDRPLLFAIIHDVTERKLLEQQILNIGETERQRIGRDLHDSLGGMLTGAALLSKALAHRLATKATAEAAVAEDVLRCINDAISQARAVARGLLPMELGAGGLVAGLREFANEVTRWSGVVCRLRAAKGPLIPDASVALHLFRIVQEAVRNALRHGGARRIEIRFAKSSGQIRVEVRDDGKGLPSRRRAANGLGFRTMKYRADAIGAQLTVESSDGRGTVVSCLLPVTRPPQPDSH